MGVQFDRVLDGFDGPFEKVSGIQSMAPGRVGDTSLGVVLSHTSNNAFLAVNRLLAAGREVRWIHNVPGYFYLPSGAGMEAELRKIAADTGVSFEPAAADLRREGAIALHPVRVALADQYGGSMPSGWTRFILEQFEFPFEVVYPKALDSGDLSRKFDVIIFPSGVGPADGGGRGGAGRGAAGAAPGSAAGSIPAEYQDRLGSYTAARTLPGLRKFVEEGGTILAVGRSAMTFAQLFDLPIRNHLAERDADGSVRALPPEKYYVPGSVLRMTVDTSVPIAHGLTNPLDVFFDNSPTFAMDPDAALRGVRPVAWFADAGPLRSGWAFGQGYLKGGVAVAEAAVGKGRIYLFGPEITFRAQPHGTFKFLFNGIYLGARSPGTTAVPSNSPR